ncbi:MAG: LysR family transcriptional regulator [Rhodobacteraceae bacterium]|nr:LysR family transcriptional regulator [Paracoccaceae bacterium]
MRARQLEVFTAVMRAGTITGAARLLHTSQPALSQILIHTEDELGFKLFHREKGRLHPTPEALELYPEAERLFAGLEGMRRKTADLRLGRTGLVRIAAGAPAGVALLPQALAAYRAQYPEVLLRTYVAPLASMIEMLRSGDAALAVAFDSDLPPDIEVESIGKITFRCLLPEAHPLCASEAVSFVDLQGEQVISYRSRTRPYDELEAAAQRAGASFTPDIEIDTSLPAAAFVREGLGVAVVDELISRAMFPGVEQRPLMDSPHLPVSLLTLRNTALSRAETAMWECIRKTASECL